MSSRLSIGDADPADLARGVRVVGVVADLGRQVEGDGEARGAALEQVAVARGWTPAAVPKPAYWRIVQSRSR